TYLLPMPQMTPEQQKALQEKLKNMSPEELQEFQKQQCIFCQIISGKVPAKKVYEDDQCIAILDINPAAKGHLLLLPKEHYAIMPQIPEPILAHLSVVSKHLSQLLLKSLKVDGTTIFVANGLAAGQKAQHFMIHIIPRKEDDNALQFEEKVISKEIQDKVKVAVENKLYQLLEVKKESIQLKLPQEDYFEEKPEIFITSNNAKRYHKEKCAFAQNINSEHRIEMTPEQVANSGKKPCTCITGEKIPLPAKTKTESELDNSKKTKPNKKASPAAKSTKKNSKSRITQKEEEEPEEEFEPEDEHKVDLDDIANLFR
ncbi:MAG TPA: HIT family protein, partial [Candidatus Nanoarchaeia archaeon]|nr:HIT family protein [Candidatus Nanoarchaeia archaeon]